jgi:hypothetical protein
MKDCDDIMFNNGKVAVSLFGRWIKPEGAELDPLRAASLN